MLRLGLKKFSTNSKLKEQIAENIEKFSHLQPTILSLQNYIDYGTNRFLVI